MSQRTILAVDTLGDMFVAKILRAPAEYNVVGASLGVLNLDPDNMPDLQSDSAVLARGKMVRDALRQNQSIRGLLDHLSQISPHEVRPLCVVLGPTDAERINWEMLCDQNDTFCALDQRWPIARIIDPINAPSRLPSEMATPIKLMAVISALGIHDQETEWDVLRDAVRYANDIGLQVKLKALIGDAELLAKAEQEIAQAKAAHQPGAHDIEVAPIETTSSRLTQSIRMWSPNILHVFCHGHADGGNQSLEFATANDHEQYAAGDPDTTAGSVIVPAQNLAALGASLVNPWLLVLNCCSSGKADVGLQSMANQIVSKGFPAVVATMEPVKARDAYELTRSFYPQAFDLIKKASDELAQKNTTALDWAPLMHQARCAISELDGRAAEKSPEWSVPLLYLRGIDPHVFERGKGHTPVQLAEYRVVVETTAAWLRTAGQQLSEAQRIEVMEDTLAKVPRTLWPSPDGNLNRDPEQP